MSRLVVVDIMGDSTDTTEQLLDGELLELSQLVEQSEILQISSPDYLENTQTWSVSKDKKPRLVLRPISIESLSRIVTYLSHKDLDYRVRSQGYGSSSATDVLISLSAFNDFEFNREDESVLLGSGGNWEGYYERMHAVAPDWTSQ